MRKANAKNVQNIINIYGVVDGPLPSHVADVIGMFADENDSAFGLILEYVEGVKTLSNILYPKATKEPKVPLSMREQVYILKEIASALADMHLIGLIHGDVKPQNILVSSHTPPLIKLIDFGLANLRENAAMKAFGNSTLKSTLNFKGTMVYSAPEMLTAMTTIASGAVSSRSTDVYAFAILCWELLSQRRPFDNDANFPQSVIDGVRPSLNDLPSDTPAGVIRLLQSCWSADRNLRLSAIEFQGGHRVWYDMKEMGHDLQQSMIDGIEKSKVVLICLNKLYLTRENCLFELKEAYKRNKILLVLIIEPKVQEESREAIQLCQLKRKLYVDLGTLAIDPQWYNPSGVDDSILMELNQRLGPLFALLKKVDCLPSCLTVTEEEEKEKEKLKHQVESEPKPRNPLQVKEFEMMSNFCPIDKENPIVIIDFGTLTTRGRKIGFHDQGKPFTVPSIFGYPISQINLPLLERDIEFGDEAYEMYYNILGSCHSLLSTDILWSSWLSEYFSIVEHYFRCLFYQLLEIDPCNSRVLFVISPSINRRILDQIADMLVFRFKVSELVFCRSAVLALLGSGRQTGIVIECGEAATEVTYVMGLRRIHEERVMISGKDITDHMIDSHNFRRNAFGYSLSGEYYYFSEQMREILRTRKFSRWDENFSLGNFLIAGLFQYYDNTLHDHYPNLSEAVINCLVHDNDGDTQEELSRNIIICGGGSRLEGFLLRLQDELSQCTDYAFKRVARRVGRVLTADRNITQLTFGAEPTYDDKLNRSIVEKLLGKVQIHKFSSSESLAWDGASVFADYRHCPWKSNAQWMEDFHVTINSML